MRALYVAMETLLPPWGLARHWWVLIKLGLTVPATVVLLAYTGTLATARAAGAAT